MMNTLFSRMQAGTPDGSGNVETIALFLSQCDSRGYGPARDLLKWEHCLLNVQIGFGFDNGYTVADWAAAMKQVWGDKGLNAMTLSAGLGALQSPAYTEAEIAQIVIEEYPDDLVISIRVRTADILKSCAHDGYVEVGRFITMTSNQADHSSGQGSNELDNEGLHPGQGIVWLAEPDPSASLDLTEFCVGSPGLTEHLITPPTKLSPVSWQCTVRDNLPENATYAYHFNIRINGSNATYWFDPWLGDK